MRRAVVVGVGNLTDAIVESMMQSGWEVERQDHTSGINGRDHCTAWVNCVPPTIASVEFVPRVWASSVADRTLQLAELCEHARTTFTSAGGAIVNVLGVEAQFAAPEHGVASVAEAAAAMLTRTLGVAWAPQGIRVNGVAIACGYHPRQPRHPAGRLPTDREIAEAVAFLASPEAAYVTAEILRVDCGWGANQLF